MSACDCCGHELPDAACPECWRQHIPRTANGCECCDGHRYTIDQAFEEVSGRTARRAMLDLGSGDAVEMARLSRHAPAPLPAWFVLLCLAAVAVMAWIVYVGATYEGPPPR